MRGIAHLALARICSSRWETADPGCPASGSSFWRFSRLPWPSIYRLEEIPFAIFRDEARHGLLALRLQDEPSYRPLFLGQPINQPLPYFLAMAAALRTFGSSLLALRVVSAVAGALAVPLLYGLVREVFGRGAAFVAALLLAASSWPVAISRFAVNYVEPSLFSLPAYWLLWRALPQARIPSLCLAAFLVGLGQYSAHTAKALLVVTAGS